MSGTAEQLARDIKVPIDEINFVCAGINHMAFYMRFEMTPKATRWREMYPRIRQVLEEGGAPQW